MATMSVTRNDSQEAVAGRLRLLRKVVSGENQTAFAARIGIEPKRWNNFERGSPLSKEVAILLVQKFPDITLDWLFLGRSDGLTVKRQRELEEAGKSGMTPAKRPSSSRGG
ncbi:MULTISPECIES: helix-turn-helix transcriptional regulator [unclassified Bradyrhizobium]|uniref:helix-turn-helix transcriptional regulator n=1 Tax=unclassified Bradyrhizobium TaxID=2631580 RepID=UPI0029168B2C|nr:MULTISPECIES: helix-turn-helix transcriptional regulator [unclassified Bradyrhizobium]